MMKKIIIVAGSITIGSLLLKSCGNPQKKATKNTTVKTATAADKETTPDCPKYLYRNKNNNLNISILLDLSDRIDDKRHPNPAMPYFKRDLGYINSLTKGFINHIEHKKIIMLKDQMQVFFEPAPADSLINKKSQALKVAFNKDIKKVDIKNALAKYNTIPKEIYNIAIKNKKYIGSDTWRFFKDKVKNYCIANCNRNILVILTDGYMFHINTKLKDKNKTSYITPRMLRARKLTKGNWKQLMAEKNYGFIPATTGLSDLEVLVLGVVNYDKANPYGKSILTEYWTQWLTAMGVKHFKIYGADLPSNMEEVIQKFIGK